MSDEELKQLLETQAAETRRHFDVKLEATNQRIDASAAEIRAVDVKLDVTNQRIDANAAEIRADFDVKLEATNQRIDANAAEIRADSDAKLVLVNRHVVAQADVTRQHIEVIAEHLRVVDENLSRRIDHLEAAMQQGFEDTNALIRFAYTDLDRRVRVLEQSQ